MNIENIEKLKGIIELVLENESRINEHKPVRYWYPLSLATFGVNEIIEALDSMCSFRTSMAEKTLQFERKFTQYNGSCDSVMVNSGSSADLLLCQILRNPFNPLVEEGSEILIPAVTWPTQIWSAMMCGLKVKLVDVDPKTLNVSIEDLERKISKNTKAIFLVHIMGNPCNMDSILQIANAKNLFVLEDCCEALGAKWSDKNVGNFGLGGTYSFFFSHHITTMEGGMISVQNTDHAEQLRLLRAHGWSRNSTSNKYGLENYPDIDPRYSFVNWGMNVRPTEVQSGFGIRQLEKLPQFTEARDKMAVEFYKYISQRSRFLMGPEVHPKSKPNWMALPVMIKKNAPFKKSELLNYLELNGIETRPVVTGNIARQPVAKLFSDLQEAKLPGADLIHEYGFYIGLSPLQSIQAIHKVIEIFDNFLKKY